MSWYIFIISGWLNETLAEYWFDQTDGHIETKQLERCHKGKICDNCCMCVSKQQCFYIPGVLNF